MATANLKLKFFSGAPVKLSWGAIFGGTLVALGFWILFQALGLALGLSSINPNDLSSAKAAGIGAGIWGVVATLLALFLGGVVASRTAGTPDRFTGAIHGAVLWSLATVAGLAFLGMVVGRLASGVAGAGKAVASATGSAVAGAGGQDVSQAANALGLDMNDLLRPINQRLRQEGKPAVTADQLEAATKDIIGQAVRQGRLDRELLVGSISRNTSLSRSDADDLAARIESSFNAKKDQLVSQVQVGAGKAANVGGKAFWGVFFGLLLGLISAVLGASVGVASRSVTTGTPIVPPVDTRREVYP